ncbi:MAG: hypothetical protein KBT48_08255 [Firmicutes bacterium]|nr:hypothetical protein [Bacillota bacterium]
MCNLSVGIREEGRCEGKHEGRLEEMINGIRNMIESFFMLHVQKEECIQIVTEKYSNMDNSFIANMIDEIYEKE